MDTNVLGGNTAYMFSMKKTSNGKADPLEAQRVPGS